MTDIGELVVRVKADSTQLEAGMKNAAATVKDSSAEMTSSLDSAKKAFGLLGVGLSTGALVEFTKGALEAANNLYIMGQRTGFASDTLSKLNIPLKQNGSSVDEFSSSMKFLSRNIELAAEGNPALIGTFDSLGLSVTKLKSLTPEQQFYAVANAMSQVSDQGKFTADGMAIMGRGFASIAPLIKAASGNMEEFVNKMDGLTKEQINEVHELDDRWTAFLEHLKIGAVEAALAIVHLSESQRLLRNEDTLSGVGGVTKPSPGLGTRSDERPNTVNLASFVGKDAYGPAYDPNRANKSAKGSNSDLTGSAANDNGMTIDDFVDKLNEETAALSKGKEAFAEYKAEMAAASATGLKWSELTKDDKDYIDSATQQLEKQRQAQEELTKQKQKDIQVQAQMEHEISSSLASIALNYKNLGQTISDMLKKIAQQLIEQEITNPLVSGISKALPSGGSIFSGLGKLLGFADGGNPPVGVPSIVGENGPELFIPQGPGTIVPNNKLGGQNVTVMQTINLSPGLAETVNASIMQAAPQIAAMAHGAVIQSLQKGGSESRVVGKRS